jgi:predicted membrane-bound spermidine synthase
MPSSLRQPRLVLVGLAFFLSGAAALAYQVAWQRILALQSGVGIYSIAVIVAAFMFRLGLGSHLGGVTSVRVSARRALLLFAGLELVVAAFGAVSCTLFYDWLYQRWGWLYAEPVRAAAVHFAALALPTILMGMSLPFLARAMVRDAATASATIAFLYGINVLGAAAGALATPWLFVRHHGIRTAVFAAVVANLVAGLSALVLALRRDRPEDAVLPAPAPAPAPALPPGGEPPRPFATWTLLYAVSGFCALSLELLWFRLLDVAVKSTAYTFGTLLAIYLLGSGIGSLAGILLVRRLERPLRAFLTLQCALLIYAGAVMVLVTAIPADTPFYRWYVELWAGLRSFNLGGALHTGPLLRMYVVLPLVLFGPPTVLMGLSYPVLQRAVQDDPGTSGRKVGILQAANIAGCVVGSLFVGLVTLDLVGTTGTFRLLMLVGALLAVLGARAGARRRFALLGSALVLLAVILPGQRALWMRLHGTSNEETLVEEDATGVAAIIPKVERIWRIWAGGRSHSSLPFGGIHTTLGAAPAIIHPAPRDVAIVGLGSGDTAASAGLRRDIEQRITVFEIFEPELRLLGELRQRPDHPARLARFLDDPRFRIRMADGRHALEREDTLYDVIEADPLWPTSPYAGNLYSVEFFRLCARRLKPGGIVCAWAPTRRVRASFLAALPYVIEVSKGQILLGSHSPIPLDPDAWHARLFTPAVHAYLGSPRLNGVWADLNSAGPATPAEAWVKTNHDLFPRDEYNTPE